MLRVAVIGAGIAGLSCAARLASAGCRVDVFEKGHGTGGRLATRRLHGAACDLGAQYFTARDPRFVAQVEAWQAAGAVAPWPVTPALLDARGVLVPSPDDTLRWVGLPGMSALAHQLGDRLIALCTQTRVTDVRREQGRWTISAETDLRFAGFHAVAVALPAPQAETLLAASPRLASLAHAAVMEPCWSVAIGYAGPLGLNLDAVYARGQPVSWVARNSGKPGRSRMPETWILQAAPGWSEEHLESPPAAVAKHLHRWFAAMFAPEAPEPDWLHAHCWRFARTAHAVADAHHYDEQLQIGVCGDWCSGGRVESAWLSGYRLAGSVLAAHRL